MLVDSVSWSGILGTPVGIEYGYDNALRVTSETVTGQSPVTFQYNDPDGLLTNAGALTLTRDPVTGTVTGTSITDGSGTVTDVIVPNAFGELESYTASHGSTVLYDVTYERDAIGRVERKTETVQSQTSHSCYTYDLAGRLDQVYTGTSPCTLPCGQTTCTTLVADYGYDDNGNRISADSVTCTYDLQDRLTGCSDGTSYTYTDWGALKTKTVGTAVTTYEYDLLGNLRTVTPPPPAQSIEYIIDGLGRRVGKKVGGQLEKVWIYRDRLNPVAELDALGNLDALFVYGSKPHVPDYMIKGGNLYRFIADQLGTVRIVVKVADGSVVQRIDYDEWGIISSDTNAEFQPFGFAGGLYDLDTNLLRFGARDYDPLIGRWLATDPILFSGGINLYEYSFGDPVNLLDITGLDPWSSDDIGESYAMSAGILDSAEVQQASMNRGLGASVGLSVAMTPVATGLALEALSVRSMLSQAGLVSVSRWGRSGLQAGDWVMRGGVTYWNYFWSGKWQPGMGNQFAPFSSGTRYIVPKSALRSPREFWLTDSIKKLLGQCTYNP